MKTILFDLDDTLVPSTEGYEHALGEVGLSLNDETYRTARAEVKNVLGAGHVCARNRMLYFKRIQEQTAEFRSAELMAKMDRYERALWDFLGRAWTRLGREALMAELAKKYAFIVLSNENLRNQVGKLSAIDPAGRWFPRVLTSEECGWEKPAPQFFELAIRRWGVLPADCIYVGDSITADILPAIERGMTAFWTTEFLPGDPAPVRGRTGWREISRLEELRKYL